MENKDLNVENEFLPTDLEEANKLIVWGEYCIAQMNNCIEKSDSKGILHWALEYQRSENDLKYLKFKKTDSERKNENEKRNEGA